METFNLWTDPRIYRPVNSVYKLATRPRSEIKQRAADALPIVAVPFLRNGKRSRNEDICDQESTRLNRFHSHEELFSRDLTAIYAGTFQVGSKGHHCTRMLHAKGNCN